MSSRKKPSEDSSTQKRAQKGITKTLWDQMSSMHFAVTLLMIVLVVSVIGVLLPQPASINLGNVIRELNRRDKDELVRLGKSIREFKDQREENEFIMRLKMGNLDESDFLKLMYVDKYGRFLGKILTALSFHHLFSAWWYYLLLFLLMLNLTICSFNRLPGYIRQSFSRSKLTSPKSFKRFKPNRVIRLPMSSKAAAEKVASILAGESFNVLQEEMSQDGAELSNGIHAAYADKGGFGKLGVIPFVSYLNGLGRFGPLLTHASVVIILLGGLMTSLMSFSHYQWAGTDDTISIPSADFRAKPGYPIRLLRRKMAGWVDSLAARLSEEDSEDPQSANPGVATANHQRSDGGWIAKIQKIFEVGPHPGETLLESHDWRRLSSSKTRENIVFKVKVGAIRTSESPDGTPREYKTEATVLDPEEVYTHTIEVNRPLVYKGFYFYQSSMRTNVSSTIEHATIRVSRKDKDGKTDFNAEITAPYRKIAPVPGTDLSIKVNDFWSDFTIDTNTGKASNRSNEHNNPAVQILVYKDGKPDGKPQYLFLKYPDMHVQKRKDRYVFTMADYGKESSSITGLTIRTHPAMNSVWIGCTVMMIGMVLSFYFNHRRVWTLIEPDGDAACRLYIMGNAFRWQEDFSRKFGEICDLLAKDDLPKKVDS